MTIASAKTKLAGPVSARKLVLSLFAVVLFWAFVRWLFFEGFWDGDDFAYIRYATAWNHPAGDHMEARLLFNGLLHLSIRVFGSSPFAWALPALLGSLLILSATAAFAYREFGYGAMLASAFIVASIPGDVIGSTGANPNVLSAGFAAWATYLMLARDQRSAFAIGTVLAGISVLVHPVAAFYVIALAIGIAYLAGWRRASIFVIAALGIYFVMELGLSRLINGDAMHDFRILQNWHDPDATVRLYSPAWFLQPVQTFVFCKEWGVLALLAGVIGFTSRGSKLMRCLAIVLVCHWVWIGYGTSKPTTYEPFWRLPRLQYSVILPIALLCGAGMIARHWRAGIVILAGLNIGLVAASGSYGQADDISREFLTYARAHATDTFITDAYSLREIATYNGGDPPSNVISWDDLTFERRSGQIFMFFNPLNNAWKPLPNRPSYQAPSGLPSLCYGAPVWRTQVRYRDIALLLPSAIRQRSTAFIRRPSGYVAHVDGPVPCQARSLIDSGSPAVQSASSSAKMIANRMDRRVIHQTIDVGFAR
jgi:hypothetical protein